ncbi:tail fiber domain-containing protein [Chitinophaga sp.]|uniref:tail fiber domain-containing protein n=1 Tax=Chitinophaga sp. TaxID=1869181 RepID=UPI002F95BAA9
MKFLFRTLLLCLLSSVSYAQTVYQIRADSVRIYSACDTAELIIENHTQDTLGFLFNKGKGRTEFRKLRLQMLSDNSLAIVGQDTIPFGSGFVKLQTATAQPGGFSVAGSGFSTAQFQVKRDGSDVVSGGLALFNALQTRGTIFQLNGDINPGVSTWIHNGSAWVKRMEINSGSGVVDMPYGFIGGNASKIRGADGVDSTQSYLQFMRADGTTRMGLVGMASKTSKDIYLISDQGKVNLYPNNNSLTGYLSVEPTNLLYNGGTVTLANATSNILYFTGGGLGAPASGVRSAGTKVILASGAPGSTVDFGMGMEASNIWNSVPSNSIGVGWKFYGGATQVGRISGTGSSEWAGQGRFKGWYLSGSGAGPAAEVGYTGGAAIFAGADRTAAGTYIPVQLIGGNSPSGKTFTIDGTGYRLNQLTNAVALGTDANGYIVDGSANFIKNSTSQQTANFNVSGAGTLGGNLTVGGNGIVTGSITATGFNQPSLRALKMNIKACELDAIKIIDSLKICEFEYKKDPGKKVIGIIADDEPSIICGEKHDHLDMMNAVGLLLKSVQELNARVERLEQQISKERSSK